MCRSDGERGENGVRRGLGRLGGEDSLADPWAVVRSSCENYILLVANVGTHLLVIYVAGWLSDCNKFKLTNGTVLVNTKRQSQSDQVKLDQSAYGDL